MKKPKRPDVELLAKGAPSKGQELSEALTELALHTLAVEADVKARETRLTNLAKKLYTHECKKTHAQIGWNGDTTAECQLCEEKDRADRATALEAAILKAAVKVTEIDWGQDNAPDKAHDIFMEALKTPRSKPLQELTALVQSIMDAVHQSKVTEANTLGSIVDAVIPFAHLGEKK